MVSPDIKVCKVFKQSSSEKIKIKPFPVLEGDSPMKKSKKKIISVSKINK